jgi:LysR family cys regulon transcriptional activator
MNFNQLRYVCGIVDRGLSMSRAAQALRVAQPVVSRQIQLLERELGVTLFVRNRKRILSLSEPGAAVLEMARRILRDEQDMRSASAEHANPGQGELVIATTHAHARYALPRVMRRYATRYPGVRVTLHEGTPAEIADWLSSGRVDLSISGIPLQPHRNLVFLPFETLRRVVLVPPRHRLLKRSPLTLEDLAAYPIVTFHPGRRGGESIEQAFLANGLSPRFAVRATNADVIQACVRAGLGIGIVSGLAAPARREPGIRSIDAGHLFPLHEIAVGLRKGQYLREFVHQFIHLAAPALDRARLRAALAGGGR